jgi:hypothetical protein
MILAFLCHHFLRSGVLLPLHYKCSALTTELSERIGTGVEPVLELLLFQLSYLAFKAEKDSNLRHTTYGGDCILMQQHTDSYCVCTVLLL